MKNDLGCQKLHLLATVLKKFWQQTLPNQPYFLNQPGQVPEFSNVFQILNSIDISDINAHPSFQQALISSVNVQMLPIFNNKKIVIQLVFLPPKYCFEIHDHPEMLLVSKVLKGEATVTKYDLVNRDNIYEQIRRADFSKAAVIKKGESHFGPGDVDLLFPDNGNLHSIYSHKRVVLLEILVNAFDHTKRPCTFFRLGEQIESQYYEVFHFTE